MSVGTTELIWETDLRASLILGEVGGKEDWARLNRDDEKERGEETKLDRQGGGSGGPGGRTQPKTRGVLPLTTRRNRGKAATRRPEGERRLKNDVNTETRLNLSPKSGRRDKAPRSHGNRRGGRSSREHSRLGAE